MTTNHLGVFSYMPSHHGDPPPRGRLDWGQGLVTREVILFPNPGTPPQAPDGYTWKADNGHVLPAARLMNDPGMGLISLVSAIYARVGREFHQQKTICRQWVVDLRASGNLLSLADGPLPSRPVDPVHTIQFLRRFPKRPFNMIPSTVLGLETDGHPSSPSP